MTPFETVLAHYEFPEWIKPHPLQVSVINDLAPTPNNGLWLDMGCVDSETEYLSPNGWVSIAAYDGGQVAQFVPVSGWSHQHGRAEFVQPIAFIKKPCEEMIRFKTSRGVDQKLSADHRVAHILAGGGFNVASAQEVFNTHERNKMGWKGRFITTFSPPVCAGIGMTDAELRLMVAVIADGNFPNHTQRCVVRVKKGRKIERMQGLLEAAGVTFTELDEPWDGCAGFVRFQFEAPLRKKVFDGVFYSATRDQLQIIIDEAVHWDSSVSDDPKRGFRFFSSVRESADFIQYALCSVGVRSTVTYTHRTRVGRPDSHEYVVQAFARSNLAYLAGCEPTEAGFEKTKTAWLEPSTDGFQYCFTVPSSFLVLRRNGCVFITGNCGKTFVYTAMGLYHKIQFGHQVIIAMPPILLRQWERWLRLIRPKLGGAPLTITNYMGTPAKRKTLNLDADFIVVGVQVFKRDYERFVNHFQGKRYSFAFDEATAIGNIESDNHVKCFDFSVGHPQTPMSGTPIGVPMDAYALMKMSAPGTYRNLAHFQNMHVEERDFYKRPTKFMNLDVLNKNIMVNSKRVLFEDMFPDVEEPLFDPIYYDLEPTHYRLYRKLAEEQLLLLPDGGKIDGTTANKLTHALGQIVVNWGHFSGMPADVSACSEMIAQKLSDLGQKKLVVFAHYKMTVAGLASALSKFGAVTINSEVSEKQKDKNLQAFINDPKCRVIIIQFISGGKGLDGMQHASHHCFFAEPCQRSRDFHQCVARLKRLGQRFKVHVMMGIANGTTQVRGFKNLLTNDSLVNEVIRNAVDLRNAIYGINQ